MALFDLSLEELQTYRAPTSAPDDFDSFWAQTLAETRALQTPPIFARIDSGLRLVNVDDVTFSGYGGQPIKAWYIRPAGVTEPLPCVVEFIGYGGGRGFPHSWLDWANAGYAHFVMDSRGQGSEWRRGDTPDLHAGGSPAMPGYMTQGIHDPQQYYYRRFYADAARAVETVRERADIDGGRIAVTGGSQGGGLSIAAAALVPDGVQVCVPDVPFLCHFRRAVTLIDTRPYNEIAGYLKTQRDRVEATFRTLDYFDGVNLAPRIKAACFFSTALMDDVCPPSTVFAAYNALTTTQPKQIAVYPFNKHEGGGDLHFVEKLKFIRGVFGY
ncbi:MAG: alpha/beta fold hydrolase [Chloroflexota bacterium]|nr:alpha/beta fold hydrolase [Chloroflexota bacterium]